MRPFNKSHFVLYAFFIVFLMGCLTNGMEKYKLVDSVLIDVKNKYAPDKRVALMDINASIQKNIIYLKGETDQPGISTALIARLTDKGFEVVNEVRLLPDPNLEGGIYGVINNSVSNIRSKPKHSGELATQALLGTDVKVLKKEGSWYLVQTPDKYISWIDHGGLVIMNETSHDAWSLSEKVIYLEPIGYVYAIPESKKDKIADIVMGCQLKLVSELDEFYEVQYPDGRLGFIEKSKSEKLVKWLANLDSLKQLMVSRALSLNGTPYLWGGTSSKGMDCSGFTKTVYLMSGLVIPRDASQQVNEGLNVDPNLSFNDLEIGDLLFFGKPATDSTKQRTTHVGMWIGDNQFIHASRNVRVSSVDENTANYDEANVKRYLGSQRYLNNLTSGIIDLKEKSKM
ncbi:MAG: hypothetical protein ACJA2S_005644 [Cyclobacteriaceae bacterium]|jgi:hypothetical protein